MHSNSVPVSVVRLLAAVGTLALAVALLAAVPPAQAEEHGVDVTPARVEGENRFETAANIARLTFDSAPVAIVVTGQDFPDALAGSYAAGKVDGPLLLVTRTDVPRVTLDVLAELEVSTVNLIGGTGTISAEVEERIADAGYETNRVFGTNRYETSAEVARAHTADDRIGTVGGERTAILASGEDYPDALAAGPLAASNAFPLFLTPRDRTTHSVNSAIADLGIRRLIVVGGQGAVSSEVVQAYQDAGYTVERFGGSNRMATSVVVADNALARFGFSVDIVLLARGNDFPDALAASIHGAALGAPILLSATPETLSSVTTAWFEAACPHVDAVRALGGVGAISTSTLGEAEAAAERCEPEDPPSTQDYIVAPQEKITAQPGYEREWRLLGEFDVPPGELALFPCSVASFESGGVVFNDADDDGFADASGMTETNEAWISRIDGHPQVKGQDRHRATMEEGFTFHTKSDAEDCAVPVLWEAGDHETELPVDSEGLPTVRYGAAQIRWTSGD